MHRYRAPSIAPGTFFVAQSWADFIINMSESSLRQAPRSDRASGLTMRGSTGHGWCRRASASMSFAVTRSFRRNSCGRHGRSQSACMGTSPAGRRWSEVDIFPPWSSRRSWRRKFAHFSERSADHPHCRAPNLGTENRNSVGHELGAMARAGTINLAEVVAYAEAAEAKGFVFMDAPGHDRIAATG